MLHFNSKLKDDISLNLGVNLTFKNVKKYIFMIIKKRDDHLFLLYLSLKVNILRKLNSEKR